jgi:PAS domain S-box-containing protein
MILSSLFFEKHPDPMWVFDEQSLAILEVNEAAQARYGYTRDQFLTLTLRELRPAEDVPKLVQAVATAHGEANEFGCWRHLTRDGRVLHVDIRTHRVQFDGRPARLAVARDVTRLAELEAERKKLLAQERELKEAHSRMVQQQATMQIAERLIRMGTWELDLQTGKLDWSQNTYAIFGVDARTFDHSFDAFVALIHPEDRERLCHEQAEAVAGRSVLDIVYRIGRPDGSTRIARDVGELRDTAQGRIFTGVVQDITEERLAEARSREAESLLAMAGEAARFGAWRYRVGESRITWSRQTALIHGMPPGYSPTVEEGLEFYAPEFRDPLRSAFGACLAQGAPFDEVAMIVSRAGTQVWVRAMGQAEHDADGRIVGAHGAFQDITEIIEARAQSYRLSRKLEQTLDHLSDAFFTLDQEWRFTFVNAEAARLLQSAPQDLIGHNVWDKFPAAIGSEYQRQYERAMSRQETVQFTAHYAPLNLWTQVTAYSTPEGLAIHFQDVGERLAAQERLRLLGGAAARLNDILLITEARSIAAPDGPRIVYVNASFTQRTGFAFDEVVGRTPRVLQGPRTQRTELDRIRRALEQRQSVRAELINYTRHGEEFWVELDITPLMDEHGEVTHFVSVQRDIGERKRAEEAARVDQERFRLVSRATNDVIWDWDLTTDALWWGEGIREAFGYDPESVGSTPDFWLNHVHPDDRERVSEKIFSTIGTSASTWSDDYRLIRADGKPAFVVDRGFIIRDENGVAVRMVGAIRDVTAPREQRERSQQSQRLEAIGELTGGVAHDFNNLLTVILGNAELLGERLQGDEQLFPLAQMTASAALRGSELTQRLLAFARRQPLAPERIDVNRQIISMQDLLRRTLALNITLRFEPEMPLWSVEADPAQLEMTILNLAINARDAMPKGGELVITTANAQRAPDGGTEVCDFVEIAVADNGTGMSRDVVARAFDPFFTTKEIGKGTGLGLSMVYGFARQSGGYATIESEEGRGTRVAICLPRSVHAATPERSSNEQPAPRGGSERILVVEDDALVRRHVVSLLRGLGYRVIEADGAKPALDLLEQAEVDLLFTDVMMAGGMNGRELADEAAQRRPGIKILLTSGHIAEGVLSGERELPGGGLLSKPYSPALLASRIRQVLDA